VDDRRSFCDDVDQIVNGSFSAQEEWLDLTMTIFAGPLASP
jgi:hypothetical protein